MGGRRRIAAKTVTLRGSPMLAPQGDGNRLRIEVLVRFDNRAPLRSIAAANRQSEILMIIDCHGHYTTEPKDLSRFRKEQTAAANAKDKTAMPSRASLKMSDDEIRESIEKNQLKLQRERGTNLTIFSPRASGMGHHIGDESVSLEWSQICNDLIARVVLLYPQNFVGVCQLPQSPGVPPKNATGELERCVRELGFIGCNLNPDPSGGYFNSPPLTDKWWYPFYEKMVELDVPAMIHVSGCCNPAMHTTGSYYLNADTMAFMQLILSDLFKDFPTLKLIIPHGGGAVPFHWGRFRGLALNNGRPELTEIIKNNIFFDTCVYHQPGINLLAEVVPADNILFASEMVGAVKGIDPKTGFNFDDTKRYVDAAPKLSAADRQKIFEGNAHRVFGRLKTPASAKAPG
jgi:4-oxalmesaconate hydratase